MSKRSNIALAILIGAAAGGIVALVLKAERMLEAQEFDMADGDNDYDEEYAEEEDEDEGRFEMIARQFSDRISADLRTAESKIRSATQQDPALKSPGGEKGMFL